MNYRIESDTIGEKKIPANCYYGIQALRATENFKITGRRMDDKFINSLVQIKKAAAITNRDTGLISKKIAEAIVQACDEIIDGKLHDQFVVDPVQGGAGTSANMNTNEVIANRSIEILGGEKGNYHIVNPNDHVNMGQSTNDVFPTAAKITTLKMIPDVVMQLKILNEALEKKSKEFFDVVKMGRTQLQDAVPITLGQEFYAYSSVVKRDIVRLDEAKEKLRIVNMGGTAIGTSINANQAYVKNIVPCISSIINMPLEQAPDLIDSTQNLDVFVLISSVVKVCAIDLSKMSNDLRLMSSGPRAGFNEITLPPKQNGSSIMPGKVNPVIPEVMTQIAFNIIGNDLTIAMAAESGQLELNAFEPIIFYKLFESLTTLSNGISTLVNNCIKGIVANRLRCKDLVNHSIGIVTAISPYIGYEKAAKIAKIANQTGKSVKEIISQTRILENQDINKILDPTLMTGQTVDYSKKNI